MTTTVELPDLSLRRSARQRLVVAAGTLVAAGSVGAAAALFGHVEHGPAGDHEPYPPAGPTGENATPQAAPPVARPANPGNRSRPAAPRPRSTPVLAVLASPTDDAVTVTPAKPVRPYQARSWPVREEELPRPRRAPVRRVDPLDGLTGTLSGVTGAAGDVVGLVGEGEQRSRHRARSGSSDSVQTLRAREGKADRDDYPRHRKRHAVLDPLGLL